MPEFKRRASGNWSGDLQSGSGTASTQSGGLKDTRVTFSSRFSDAGGANPEELVAAAEASCFSMALAHGLSQAGHVPELITTDVTVTLHFGDDGIKITKMHIATQGKVPGIDQAAFQKAAEDTKVGCPVSKLLTPGLEEVTLDAKLV